MGELVVSKAVSFSSPAVWNSTMSGAVAQANNPHRGAAWGEDNLYVAVSLHQLQQCWLFESVSQEWQRRKGVLADPFQEGRPAGVTSANACTLSLWAGDEDHTLTRRQRKRGKVSERTITQSLQDFGIFLSKIIRKLIRSCRNKGRLSLI